MILLPRLRYRSPEEYMIFGLHMVNASLGEESSAGSLRKLLLRGPSLLA